MAASMTGQNRKRAGEVRRSAAAMMRSLFLRLGRKRSRFMALPAVERRLLLRIAFLLPLFMLGLRAVGLSRFLRLLRRRSPTGQLTAEVSPCRLGELIGLAGANICPRASCLNRSLLLHWMLGRRGLRSELRIGVRLEAGVLTAHAWVEHEGQAINEPADHSGRYEAFSAILDDLPAQP